MTQPVKENVVERARELLAAEVPGELSARRLRERREAGYVETDAALRAIEKAISSSSPSFNTGVAQLAIGTRVRCVAENLPAAFAEDWRDWEGFIAGIGYCRNEVNYTVSDEWPPVVRTDGFAPNELAALSDQSPSHGDRV